MIISSIFPILQKYKAQINCMIVSILFAHSVGRIGCYLNDCCFGALGIFPVQLVEALFLFILGKRFIKKDIARVDIVKYYVIFYGVFRFFLEFYRQDDVRGIAFGISTSQFISFTMVAIIFVHWIFFERKSQAHIIQT